MAYVQAAKTLAVKQYADLSPVLSALEKVEGNFKIIRGSYSKGGVKYSRYLIENSDGNVFDYRQLLASGKIKDWKSSKQWGKALKSEKNWSSKDAWASDFGAGFSVSGFQEALSLVPSIKKEERTDFTANVQSASGKKKRSKVLSYKPIRSVNVAWGEPYVSQEIQRILSAPLSTEEKMQGNTHLNPQVLKQGETQWAASFSKSMAKQASKPNPRSFSDREYVNGYYVQPDGAKFTRKDIVTLQNKPVQSSDSLSKMAASPNVKDALPGYNEYKLTNLFGRMKDIYASVAKYGAEPLLDTDGTPLMPITPAQAYSIMYNESRVTHEVDGTIVKSNAGALGIMQVMRDTFNDVRNDYPRLNLDNIANQDNNIHAGIIYLRQMLTRNEGNFNKATMAYNCGPGRLDKFTKKGIPVPDETQIYLRRVNNTYSLFSTFDFEKLAKTDVSDFLADARSKLAKKEG